MPGLTELAAGRRRWRIPTVRLTRYHLFLLGGLFLIFMGPLAFTQPGPGGGKQGRQGGPSPDFMFAMMSGGNDVIDIKNLQVPQWMTRNESADSIKEKLLAFNQKKGITDGKMTKAVYAEYFEERMTEFRAKMAEKNKEGGTPGAPPQAAQGGPSAPPTQDIEAQARESFARHDADKNGSLSVDEMRAASQRGGHRLLDELAKWDTNKNGTIEFPEYLEYYKDRAAQGGRFGRAGQTPPPAAAPVEPAKPVEDDKRPTVYRTGKMPKELPAWFEEADKDKDGQVGLYEWKASGKSVSEFLAMDHNGDGFITVEEILRHQRVVAKSADSPTASSSSSYTPPRTRFTPSQADSTRGNDQGDKGGNRMNFGGRGRFRMKGN